MPQSARWAQGPHATMLWDLEADMPALEALDGYTMLGRHEQTACSDRSFERSATVRY